MHNNLTADQIGYLKFAIGGVGATAMVLGVLFLNSLRPVLDEELCIVGSAPLGHSVLIADISEVEDAHTLPGLIRDTADRLPQYHRMSVYRVADLTETPTEAELAQGLWPLVQVFSACNPGRGDEVNPMVVGSRYAEKRYQQMFASPLDAMINATAERAGSRTSPILDALSQIPLIEDFDGAVPERHLAIRSDFLEHTPSYSHYARDIGSLDQALDRLGVSVPDLRELSVRVDFVRRTSAVNRQTTAHRDFWDEYFHRARGRSQPQSAAEAPMLAAAP